MPRSNAICLLACPATNPLRTSRSRFDNAARRASMLLRSAWRFRSRSPLSSADRTDASRTSSSKGFSRKSTAPSLIASTASGISPCAVMTMTGTASLSSRNRRKRSMPLSSGILTSVMMQPVWTVGATSRKTVADSYVRTSRPADPSWKASAWRTASSSSITWTMGLSGGIVEILPGRGPYGEPKDRSAGGIGLHRDLPAVRLDNGAADRQADTHSLALVGDKGLEELRHQFRRDPGSGIGHADGDHIVVGGCGGDDELASLRRLHGLDRISQQIEQHLLNLHLVDKDRIDGWVELKPHTNVLILGSDQRQGARFLNEPFDAFHPTLAVAPTHEFAQATDDLPRAQSLIAGLVQSIAHRAQAVLDTAFEQASRALHVAHNGQ